MKKIILIISLAFFFLTFERLKAQDYSWPKIDQEALAGSRWWWLGSAVDSVNLSYLLTQYHEAGMGTMEITPIYGVKDNDSNEIDFLSKKWMDIYSFTLEKAKNLGMAIDMNMGTGWPFGGPKVSIEDAASKLVAQEYQLKGGKTINLEILPTDEKQKDVAHLERLMAFSSKGEILDLTLNVKDNHLKYKLPKGSWHIIAAFQGKTFQKVKRAAPGGEGLVMDHFSKRAVKNYLDVFKQAFKESGALPPHLFFNDSYEVYGADWTQGLFDSFYKLRGYKLENHLEEFLSKEPTDISRRLISDYRETLSDLLLENFINEWTEFSHSLSSGTRSQAHGSPGNLIDLYAGVDVPECEGFGLSDFGIKGLRKDSLTRKNFSDLSMLKYASSAAHITGKPLTSSETFTWLTEHFRTSLSQCKPDLDLMFLSGVNHVFFHGTTYSPKDEAWPGWKFYASIDMSPTNSLWKAAPLFFDYISRCQSFLQWGTSDNDFLIYLPIYDLWYEGQTRLLMFDINKMKDRAPRFIEAINKIISLGYDVDYISDKYILSSSCIGGEIQTIGRKTYKAIIIPSVRLMPLETLEKLLDLAKMGAKIVILEKYPEDVPGLFSLEERREKFGALISKLKSNSNVIFGSDYSNTLALTKVRQESFKKETSLSYIRRKNETGYHYFISNLSPIDFDGWISLGTKSLSAIVYNPLNKEYGKVPLKNSNDTTKVYIELKSGESIILRTFSFEDVLEKQYKYYEKTLSKITLDGNWDFSFIESEPKVTFMPKNVPLGSWTQYEGENLTSTCATALYKKEFNIDVMGDEYLLSLGDVREIAKVRINSQDVQYLWSLPYECYVGKYLKKGKNILEVEVTNLPANRIAEMDREKIQWRKFKEINVVNLDYKTNDYSLWEPMESGLLGPVNLTLMKEKEF